MDSPDRVVLRLSAAGVNVEKIEFPHLPGTRQARLAKLRLIMQGCLTTDGKLTTLGTQVNKLPLSVPYALMVSEALRLGVAREIITIAAIFDTDPLITRGTLQWTKLVGEEKSSNAIAQLTLFRHFESMSAEERRSHGAHERNYQSVKEKQQEFTTAVKRALGLEVLPSGGDREAIIRCLTQGMLLYLYRRIEKYLYATPTDPYLRRLGPENVIGHPEWVVGVPWNIDSAVEGRRVKLLSNTTAIDPKLLCEIAPWLVHTRTDSHCRYVTGLDAVKTRRWNYFLGHMIGCEEKIVSDHPEAERFRTERRVRLTAKQLLLDLENILARHRQTPCLKKAERQEIQRAITEKVSAVTPLELTAWIQRTEKLRTFGQQEIQPVAKPQLVVSPPELTKSKKLHTHTLYLHRNEAVSLAQVVDSEQSQGTLNRDAVWESLGEELFQALTACGYLVVKENDRVVLNADHFTHTAFTINEQNLPKKGRLLKASGGQLYKLKDNWRSRLRRAISVANQRVIKKEAVTQS